MMARFIAMYVSTYQAFFRNILIMFIVLLRQMHGEEFVQFLYECLFSSHQVDHTKHIMRYMEGEVP